MVKLEPCRNCSGDVIVSPERIARILKQMIKTQSVTTIDEEMYQRHLSICQRCPDLQFGTTCRYCGCLVQVRAKIAGKCCPHPAGAKW